MTTSAPSPASSVALAASAPEGVRIAIRGILDEDLPYEALNKLARGHTVLDLDGVVRVSSFGVSRWCWSLAALDTASLSFVRCRPCMVTQFNIIRHFDCGGTLVSFYLPYLCRRCGSEQLVLYDRRIEPPFRPSALREELPCPSCGGVSEFDDVPEVYFEYILRSTAISLPPIVDRLIDGHGGG